MSWDDKLDEQEQTQRTYQNSAEARRVTQIDSTGTVISGANPLPVTLNSTTGTKINVYGTSSVASSATATLSTYTVPVGKKLFFKGVIVSGEEYGEFTFQIDSVTKASWRNSGSIRGADIVFPEVMEAIAGEVIDVKVTNNGNKTKPFEGTIFGSLFDA